MTERIVAPDAAIDELDASRTFEAFSQAEELMQDAFLGLWQRWDRVGAMDDPVGYLYRTAMNLFRKRSRRAMLALRRTVRLAPSNDDFSEADHRHIVRH